MIGGTDSHVKCGVKDYTLELQRYLEQENVDIVQINDKSDTATISDWQSIFAYHKLAVELKKINARILHVEYPAKAYGKSIGVNFLPMFARLRGIKVVFTTHEYSNRSFLGRMRQIPSFLFANEIIVVDPQFEVDIKKIPLCKKKVRTIRIGSNIVPSVAPNDKIIELHNSLVKDNMKLMSYFGFINEYKCFLELVEAIKHLKDAGKLKSKLVVIGELKESDEYHKKVLEKIREYNLDNDIIVTGYLKDSVGDYLKASDFAVLPFYYGISVRNGSFLAAYQEGIDIITTKGDKNFPYDDVYLMNDNTPQTIASAIEYMQDNSLKSEHSVVGEYTIAVKVYTVIKNILVAIYAAVTPRLATMMSETAESQYKKLNTTIWCYLSLILIPAGFGLTAVSKDVMLLVGGEEIATTSFSLQILSISLIFAIYGGLITSVYNITQGREKENLMATTVSAIINCGLNLYMIPKYSLYGAAFTTLLSELFVFVFCTLRAPNKKRFFDVDEIKNSILYAVVGSILVLLTTKVVYMLVECSALLRLIIAVALSAVVYITYLIIFKNKYTIDIVRNIMVKIKKKY